MDSTKFQHQIPQAPAVHPPLVTTASTVREGPFRLPGVGASILGKTPGNKQQNKQGVGTGIVIMAVRDPRLSDMRNHCRD